MGWDIGALAYNDRSALQPQGAAPCQEHVAKVFMIFHILPETLTARAH
jgi:hypothetical protein